MRPSRQRFLVAAVVVVFLLAIGPFLPCWPSADAGSAPIVGSTDTFWTLDWSSGQHVKRQATVRWVGEHGLIYVADGCLVGDALLGSLGKIFDSTVYPTIVTTFGPGPSSGPDGDDRVAILIYDFRRTGMDGFFDGADLEGSGAWTNNRMMFYLDLGAILYEPGNVGALAAHEFAHLITYYRDVMLDPSPFSSPEASWVAEGLATYAEHLCGYDARVTRQLLAFCAQPDTGLTAWSSLAGSQALYGAAYSFMSYLVGREGGLFIRTLVDEPLDGAAGIDSALRTYGSSDRFSAIFDDWVIAGFLDSRVPASPPYLFPDATVSMQCDVVPGPAPVSGSATVTDYGAVYLDLPAGKPRDGFQAVIDGADDAPLQAALVSWDPTGEQAPEVVRFDLSSGTRGGTVVADSPLERHTLIVWSRGAVTSSTRYEFHYAAGVDPPGGVVLLDVRGGDPQYPYVAKLLALGVISGKQIPAGSHLWWFKGTDNVLRAQFAKMIVEAIGRHTAAIDNPDHRSYSDVKLLYDGGVAQAYPYDYVEEASALGIVSGFSDGHFRPYSPITRSQLVLMVIRAAQAAGSPLLEYRGNARVFEDVPVDHPYYRPIMSAYASGILSGNVVGGKRYFYPYSTATRTQVAKITANLIDLIQP